MHFDLGMIKHGTGICGRLFKSSFTNSWFINFCSGLDQVQWDSRIDPNPLSVFGDWIEFIPQSLLGFVWKWFLWLPMNVIAVVLFLVLTLAKAIIVLGLMILIMLVSALLAVKFHKESLVS